MLVQLVEMRGWWVGRLLALMNVLRRVRELLVLVLIMLLLLLLRLLVVQMVLLRVLVTFLHKLLALLLLWEM